MVLKFSGSNKQYKGAPGGSPSFRTGSYRRPYPGFIDDTGFAPTSRVLGEDYDTRTALAAGSAGARTAPPTSNNRGWQQEGKSPGGSSWIPSVEEEAASDEVVVVEEAAVPRDWTAQVDPGVQITFGTLPGGGNDLKRIRFSREMFNKWEAQRWWGENYDRIVELYNVLTFSGRPQGASTPTSSVDDSVLRESSYSRGGSTRGSPVVMPPPPPVSKEPITRSTSCKATPGSSAPYAAAPSTRAAYYPSAAVPDPSDHVWAHHLNMLNSAAAGTSAMGGGGPSSYDPSRATTSSLDEASVSISNVSDLEAAEWIEEDEPGVCLTIREIGDGTRELRRIRFSRERFGEDRAKVWWEQNRERIQAQYL
ncbi:protein Brevis radix-like 2 isoform X2 [Phragmites australis]|uniref:protein Brevis radix-like 2 isoform X2 n=2 Tax=Phragmites australis TaxID=29695 RepID=UPI002D786309|nr:protein Brevis radix-like 2 isoform X2 [Phragmites australis]